MSTDNFFIKIIKRLKAGKRTGQPPAPLPHPDEMMGELLHMVENTDEVEIGCDKVFEMLDQYVELEARGEDVSGLFPLVKKHLERCLSCREEYEALVRVFHATRLSDA